MIEIQTMLIRFEKQNPHPKIELDYLNTYTLLVAIVLSAQSTDVGVNKATKALFSKYNTPQSMLELGLEGLKGYIKTIGLYNNKAKNIIALSQILIQQYDSKVPATMQALIELPGVGRKSANVLLANAFNMPTMGVDTHVSRVANRLGLSSSTDPDKIEQDLLKAIPAQYLPRAHHWLVLHGRHTCKAIKPLCAKCIIYDICGSSAKVLITT
jgi:endonuclease-3